MPAVENIIGFRHAFGGRNLAGAVRGQNLVVNPCSAVRLEVHAVVFQRGCRDGEQGETGAVNIDGRVASPFGDIIVSVQPLAVVGTFRQPVEQERLSVMEAPNLRVIASREVVAEGDFHCGRFVQGRQGVRRRAVLQSRYGLLRLNVDEVGFDGLVVRKDALQGFMEGVLPFPDFALLRA